MKLMKEEYEDFYCKYRYPDPLTKQLDYRFHLILYFLKVYFDILEHTLICFLADS